MMNDYKLMLLRNKITRIFTSVIRVIIIFGLAYVILFPIFQVLTLALRAPQDINNQRVIYIPENWSLLNLKIAATMLKYQTAVINSFRVSFTIMVCQVLVTAISGYAFSRLKFRGSELIFLLVLATIMIPPQTLSLNRYLYFKNFDILGLFKMFTGHSISLLTNRMSLYMMTLFGMGINSGIFIYIFRQFFRNIPIELEESAEVDGASVIRTFFSVMLPNARPAMLTVGLFAFVWQWNDIYYAQLFDITRGFPMLATQLANAADKIYNALFTNNALNLVGEDVLKNPFYYALVSNTAAFLSMLPLLVMFVFLQRYFVESIERSGIVG